MAVLIAAGDRAYVICSTPRSGSNYLCRLLASTGALGRPLEYFEQGAMQASGLSNWPADPELQFDLMPTLASSPNGVMGLKVFPHQFSAANKWASRLAPLTFVHLQRRDLLLQAISLARAKQTQAWTSSDQPRAEPVYSAAAIDEALVEISFGHARWRRYFARNAIDVLELAYEDVCADPDAAVAAIAWRLRVPGPPKSDPDLIDVRKQRDDVSEVWWNSYRAERADLDGF